MKNNLETIDPIEYELNRNWKGYFWLGVLSLILGFIGLGMEVTLTIVSMIFFSFLLVVAGITNLIDLFGHKGWKAILWQALVGISYIIAAGVIFYDPLLASVMITAFLAFTLIIMGFARIMMAFALNKSKGRGWLICSAIASIILGLLILAHWPLSGLWIIGMFISIELIITGWTYIFIGLELRKATK
jgi:uncharacterized membrane protein HdeD (DUF308 family)